jgi:hypothetical protein
MSEKPFKHTLGVVKLLEATNYASWKQDCIRILRSIRAWTIVMEEEEEPENPSGSSTDAVIGRKAYEDYLQRSAQAAAIIYGSCSAMVKLLHLNGIEGPAEMWKVLAARMDVANTSVGRMRLFRKFSTLRPIPGQPIIAYFSQLLEVTSRLVGSAERDRGALSAHLRRNDGGGIHRSD